MYWFDGRLHDDGRVPFDLSDRGLLLGDGVFDTAMALGGRIAFEEAHVARLASAAETLGFAIDRDRVVSGMRALAAAMPRAAIRTTITRGSGPRGLAPPDEPQPVHWASAAPLRDGMAFSSVTLLPVSIRRNETSPAARLKTLGYLDAVLASKEARDSSFDDALFLNTKDRIACAGSANVFLVEHDGLSTPHLDDGVLPGIVRGLIVSDLAASIGIPVRERSLPASSLEGAKALFITNSLRLLAPVSRLEQRNIPSETSAVVARLMTALRQAVAESCKVAIGEVR